MKQTSRRPLSTGLCGGFTLIELLVVIAIIALLMAIVMPSLSAARKYAQGVACASNVRQLSIAWTMYADGNDSKLVGSQVWTDRWEAEDWVHRRVQSGDPGYVTGLTAHETELVGIRTGALFPYVNSTKAYHCPADPGWRKDKHKITLSAQESPYRSYAIQDGLNGWGYFNQKPARRITQLRNPSEIYVFIEEDEGSGAHNWGSWILEKAGNSWWDPISIWHGNRSTLGYADGHAKLHLWKDETTWKVSSGELPPGTPAVGSKDLQYMQTGYVDLSQPERQQITWR